MVGEADKSPEVDVGCCGFVKRSVLFNLFGCGHVVLKSINQEKNRVKLKITDF